MPATDALFQLLEPTRLRLLESPLPEWWRAAGEVVRGLLPQGWRRVLGAQQRALWMWRDGDELGLTAFVDGRGRLLGSVPLERDVLDSLNSRLQGQAGNVPRWWLLAPSQVLTRRLSLPASAETRLRDVLVHEIDRQTPFTPDQVRFEVRVTGRDPVRRQVQVELTVVPIAVLEQELARLGPLAAGLAGVDIASGHDDRRGVNLLPNAQRGTSRDRARRWNALLAIAAGVLVLASLWLTLDNRAAALAQMQQRVDAVNGEVRQVRKLANVVREAQAAANFLAAQRARRPTQLELLADLTHRLPDTTSLEKLSVNDDRVVLIGQSQQAAALVGLLQGSPLLRSPALAGAVQTDPRTGRERFTLTATLVGAGKEAAHGDQPAP